MASLLAFVLFVLDLGSIGLVDETPPLFAASARWMAESGDWLIPHVNGLPRYDKPPLVYWLMAVFYSLPAHQLWDPLGSWSAALPSALASSVMVLLLSLLMAWWERQQPGPRQCLWLLTPLIWGLSPLVMVWSRIGVSDSLLSALLGAALLLSWLRYTSCRWPWWPSWVLLGLAVLTKGPVALVLFALTWVGFALLRRDVQPRQLRLLSGLSLSLAIALPWYVGAVWRDGSAFVESFFGYHNLQRFAQVVNHHRSPWWFYGALLLLASLPWSAALLLASWRSLQRSCSPGSSDPLQSLPQFCVCWLFAVLLLFSLSATKLPSYWLPATPAAALLIAGLARHPDRLSLRVIRVGVITSLLIAMLLAFSSRWLGLVNDEELVGLPTALDRLHLVPVAVSVLVGGALVALLLLRRSVGAAMLAVQSSWLLLVPLLFLPLLRIGDALRSRPLRLMAADVIRHQSAGQPLVVAGVIKPSLYFYGRMPVAYEGTSAQALVDLHDRLVSESRVRVPAETERLLVVAPLSLPARPDWGPLLGPRLAQHGRYGLWWLDLKALAQRAQALQLQQGLLPIWQQPRPERF